MQSIGKFDLWSFLDGPSGATVQAMKSDRHPTKGALKSTIAFRNQLRPVQPALSTLFLSRVCSGLLVLWLLAPAAHANSTLATLVSFNGTNGAKPSSGLLLARDGNFYGTTMMGGAYDIGTIFKMTPDGQLTTVASFDGSEGKWPGGDLIQGQDGNLYGTASQGGRGGDGVVFKLAPNGTLTAVFSFSAYDDKGGESPYGILPNRLVEGNDGNLYGTTAQSSFGAKGGTVFRLTPGGPLTGLATFEPQAEPGWLVKARDGRYYFTTAAMRLHLAPLATLQTVKQLSSLGTLLQGTDGGFYGTSFEGGPDRGGVVFQMAANGATTNLIVFDANYSPHGRGPSELIQGSDGFFYGTTFAGGDTNDKPPVVSKIPTRMPDGTLIYPKVYEMRMRPRLDFGTVFRMTTNGEIATLAVFNRTNGCYPTSGLSQGKDGNLYGTTSEGGAGPHASGTIFRLKLPGK